jgi:AcrR family transcriptional regulator
MRKTKDGTSNAKLRLIETANRLFYRDGIRAVGIDKIIAEADVAKMTLYTHFKSKDDLIVEVLKHREESVSAYFTAAMNRNRKKGDGIDALFAALKEWVSSPSFRGCAFINAAVELADATHPGTKFVREQKKRFVAMLGSVVESSVGKRDDATLTGISLLIEGAIVTTQIFGDTLPIDAAHKAARKLLDKRKGL